MHIDELIQFHGNLPTSVGCGEKNGEVADEVAVSVNEDSRLCARSEVDLSADFDCLTGWNPELSIRCHGVSLKIGEQAFGEAAHRSGCLGQDGFPTEEVSSLPSFAR